jgi:1-acyl-sn-glycerol-3-phosphate acyltransferase
MNAPLRPTPGKPPSDWATPWPQVVAAIGDCWQAHKQAELLPADRLTGWSLDDRDPEVIRQMLPCCRWLYHDYFQVRTDGWEHIPDDGQVMLIGSHNGGMAAPDTSMMTYDWWQRFGPDRLIYGLMDQRVWQAMPGVGRLAAQAGAVRAHPKMALAALDRGASVLIYPGGVRDVFRPHSLRHQVCLGENQAFIKLALQKSLPIIPTISYGAHSTLLVLADLYPWLKQLNDRGMPWLWGIDPTVFPIYLGLPWGLGIGPLPNIPWPMPMHTRVCPPIKFDRYGVDAARDRAYVQACHQQVQETMQGELDRLVAEQSGFRQAQPAGEAGI